MILVLNFIGFQAPLRKYRKENGSVCTFISNQLSGKRRRDLENPDLELLWIELYSIYHRPLQLGCCYRPPNSTMSFEKLEVVPDNVADKDVLLLGNFMIGSMEMSLILTEMF